jgi:hypothetical protein
MITEFPGWVRLLLGGNHPEKFLRLTRGYYERRRGRGIGRPRAIKVGCFQQQAAALPVQGQLAAVPTVGQGDGRVNGWRGD